MEKEVKSPVTVADFATQAVISLELSNAFPHDPVMAEEHLKAVATNGNLHNQVIAGVRQVFGVSGRT